MVGESWASFAVVFTAFFASHSILIRPPVRPVLDKLLTPRGFSAAYSMLSLIMLWWLIEAARTAPYVELWAWAPWQNWVPIVLMMPACLLLAFGVAVPNPFSFGGMHNEQFNPEHPGLLRWVRHPILIALFLWSAAHLVPNGNLAHAILFGAFALFSLLGMKLIDRRRKNEMGEDWERLLSAAHASPLRLDNRSLAFGLRVLVGFLLYGFLAMLHPFFTGVSLFL